MIVASMLQLTANKSTSRVVNLRQYLANFRYGVKGSKMCTCDGQVEHLLKAEEYQFKN